MQLQQQVQQMQNPLAEAEEIKQRAFLLKAQSDAMINTAKLKENERQFNVKTAQTDQHHDEDLALDITKVGLDNQTDLPGGLDA